MNKNEVITSGLLESYVLGTTNAEETAMIQNLCKQHPELEKEIEEIENGLIDFSARLSKPLPGDLKTKIASQLHFAEAEKKEQGAQVIPIATENKLKSDSYRIYRFGMAASLLLFATSLVYNVLLQQKLSKVNVELAQLNAAKSYMADEMQVQQASLKTIQSQMQVIANPMVKTVALKGMNSMDKMSAMIHWNTQTAEVYFNAGALPASPSNKQYQLWAIVDGKPVDAGMIDVNSVAQVFQKMKSVKGAQAFAVTIESMGGSPVPTMDTMCLLGNV